MRIAIEGIDGSGKETQARLLLERAGRNGVRACVVSFPRYGVTTAAEGISAYLGGEFGELGAVDPQLAGLLFATDRFESRAEVERLEAEHDVVIFDRYVASNVAHQVSRVADARKATVREWLEKIEYEVFSLPRPDATVLLDLDPVSARRAAEQRGLPMDLHERDGAYLEACRDAYLELADEPSWHTVRCLHQDGARLSVEDVADAVWSRVGGLLTPSSA